jgi:hypothetical protein
MGGTGVVVGETGFAVAVGVGGTGVAVGETGFTVAVGGASLMDVAVGSVFPQPVSKVQIVIVMIR